LEKTLSPVLSFSGNDKPHDWGGGVRINVTK
jgi:hypothetical protein